MTPDNGRKSRRELFLDEMNQVVPWSELQALVEPHYAKAGNGRRPVGLAIMLGIYFVQQWFNLSDPGMEEMFYESDLLTGLNNIEKAWSKFTQFLRSAKDRIAEALDQAINETLKTITADNATAWFLICGYGIR